MDNTFTLKDFLRLVNDEKEVFRPFDLFSGEQVVEEYQPRQRVVDNILNFSRALSVRKSRHIENIVMVLN